MVFSCQHDWPADASLLGSHQNVQQLCSTFAWWLYDWQDLEVLHKDLYIIYIIYIINNSEGLWLQGEFRWDTQNGVWDWKKIKLFSVCVCVLFLTPLITLFKSFCMTVPSGELNYSTYSYTFITVWWLSLQFQPPTVMVTWLDSERMCFLVLNDYFVVATLNLIQWVSVEQCKILLSYL